MFKMSGKKTLGFSLILVLLMGLLAGCGGDSGDAGGDGDKVQVWKIATMGPEDHQITKALKMLEEEIESRVGDQVDVQVYPNGQLGSSPDQVLGGLQNNIIELGEMAINNCAEYTTAFIPMDVPYFFLSRDQAVNFINSEAGEILRDKVREESGLELLAFLDFGFRSITNSRGPINSPADIEGLKIRTLSNPIHMKAFESLGGKPTAMAFSEVYTALQQKTIDAQENPVDTIYNGKFHEVNKYITISDHVYTFDALLMNTDTYNNLSDEIRDALHESIDAILDKQYALCQEGLEDAIGLLEDAGAEINYLSEEDKLEFQKAVAPSWELGAQMCGQDYFDQMLEIAEKSMP
jgi:tripartite ATP-independent transporter DctP family solute receptor